MAAIEGRATIVPARTAFKQPPQVDHVPENDWIYRPVQPIMRIMYQERPMHSSRYRQPPAARTCSASVMALVPLAMALLIAAPGSSEVAAQDVAAWRVECTGDGKTLDCRAVQQLFQVQRENRQLLVTVLVRKAPDPKAAAMIIQLPLGLNLTEPILLKVDNGQPEKQSIQTCTNTGCFVVFTANEKLVTAMRAGTDLKITLQDINKRPIEWAIPLLGFGVAFDKARS
jgi:invasion protein IalB